MLSISKRTLGFSFAAAMAAWCVLAAPACAGSIPVYASGHSDLCADYNATEGIFELHYHFHEGEFGLDEDGNHLGHYEGLEWIGEYEPSELYTRVSDATKTTVPSNPAYSFLGAPAGAYIWVLPQNSKTGVPFLGMGTEELDPDDWNGNINYTLKGVSGPGQLSMWSVDGWGVPTAYWATADGISSSDVYGQLADVHAHTNFGFTAEGVYEVQMQLSGTRNGVGSVSSGVETFTFLVGSSTVVPEPGAIALLASGAVGVFLSSRCRRRKKTKPINHLGLGAGPVSSSSKQTFWLHLLGVTTAFCAAVVSSAQANTFSYSYADGHAGIAAKYSGGSLSMFLNVAGSPSAKDEKGNALTTGEYAPEDIYVRAPDSTKGPRPSGTAWDFLGTDAGSDIWVMPQTSVAGQPYMGMTPGKLIASDWSGQIAYSLVGLNGPGNFSVWTTDQYGDPTTYWQSSNGYDAADSLWLTAGASGKHVNWGFTAEGVYNAQVQFSGTLAGGGPVSITKTFTFLVGSNTAVPEPGMFALLTSGLGAVGLMVWRKRRQHRA